VGRLELRAVHVLPTASCLGDESRTWVTRLGHRGDCHAANATPLSQNAGSERKRRSAELLWPAGTANIRPRLARHLVGRSQTGAALTIKKKPIIGSIVGNVRLQLEQPQG